MSDADLDALARLAAAAAEHLAALDVPECPRWECMRHPCDVCVARRAARDTLDERAPDLARHLVAAVDALRAERDQRDAAEAIIASVIGALDLPPHTQPHDLPACVAKREVDHLATREHLAEERARRDALAAAVREYGDALAAEEAARLAWKAGCSAEEDDEADVPTFRGPLTTAYDAAMRRRVTALDALLRGAAAPVVRAEVAPPCAPSTCRSDDDGDCRWNRCPQRLDGEPWVTGRVCPLSKED